MVLKLRDGAMIAGNRGSVFRAVADHNETSSFPTEKTGLIPVRKEGCERSLRIRSEASAGSCGRVVEVGFGS